MDISSPQWGRSIKGNAHLPVEPHCRLIRSEMFGSRVPNVRFGMSTKIGGVSPDPFGMNLSYRVGDTRENVTRNREIFFDSLGIQQSRLAIPAQVHGTTIRTVTEPGTYPECDALITRRPEIFLCVTVADCVPVFLVDAEQMLIAAVHAGWRGTSGGIAKAAVEKMVREWGTDPSDLMVFIGPCAGACCYSVGNEVASLFDEAFLVRSAKDVRVNLQMANRFQLQAAGIPPYQIEIFPLCTITETELLHSYRRDGKRSGRMIGVIGFVE